MRPDPLPAQAGSFFKQGPTPGRGSGTGSADAGRAEIDRSAHLSYPATWEEEIPACSVLSVQDLALECRKGDYSSRSAVSFPE